MIGSKRSASEEDADRFVVGGGRVTSPRIQRREAFAVLEELVVALDEHLAWRLTSAVPLARCRRLFGRFEVGEIADAKRPYRRAAPGKVEVGVYRQRGTTVTLDADVSVRR